LCGVISPIGGGVDASSSAPCTSQPWVNSEVRRRRPLAGGLPCAHAGGAIARCRNVRDVLRSVSSITVLTSQSDLFDPVRRLRNTESCLHLWSRQSGRLPRVQ
jgi:hypothetical protein